MERLRGAFGFAEGVEQEGDAFNRELQEQRRQERAAEREAKEREHKCAECVGLWRGLEAGHVEGRAAEVAAEGTCCQRHLVLPCRPAPPTKQIPYCISLYPNSKKIEKAKKETNQCRPCFIPLYQPMLPHCPPPICSIRKKIEKAKKDAKKREKERKREEKKRKRKQEKAVKKAEKERKVGSVCFMGGWVGCRSGGRRL